MNMEVGMHNYMYLLTYLHKYAKNASPYRCEVLDIGQVCTYVLIYIYGLQTFISIYTNMYIGHAICVLTYLYTCRYILRWYIYLYT